MKSNLIDMRCAVFLCNWPRDAKQKSKLCREHLITETIKLLQKQGDYNSGYADVKAAMEGAASMRAAEIRQVIKTIIRFYEKQIIVEHN